MAREFPDWVNPNKAAEGNRNFRGTIPLTRMERLIPMLADVSSEQHEKDVAFSAEFRRDELGLTVVRLRVQASLPLVCQASLEVYRQAVDREIVLAVLDAEQPATDVPDAYDITTLEDGRLNFMELVQDELILSVPQVPRKPDLEAVVFSTDPNEERTRDKEKKNRPFAALEGLLKTKDVKD